jgi:hypothetical protein
MKIKTGSTRHVFIFKNVVIKVARIYWSKLFIKIREKEYFIRIKKSKTYDKKYLKEWEQDCARKEELTNMKDPIPKCYEIYGTAALYFLGGIMANLQERRFYRKTKNLFVMPTYFSFFGLFNIQKRGQRIDFWDDNDVWFYLCKNSQNQHQIFCDAHTFFDINNFCLDDGFLKIVDYGNRHIEPFLEINGENLFKNFKIPD